MIEASDVKRLANEPSSEARIDIAEKIAVEFKKGDFSDKEKKIAIEIFRILVGDVEKKVRQVLSTHLSGSMDAPHDVILKLANDIKEISLPVLEHSYVLTESDLVEITEKSYDQEVMSAIARRDMVSRELSTALLKKSNLAIIETLLKNKNASIDDNGFQRIYDECQDNTSMLELMAKNGGVPLSLAEKLFVVVSDEVKKILVKKYNISFDVANDSARYVRELATLGLIDNAMVGMEVEALISHLHKNNRLTLSLLIRSLCFGNLSFFEHAIAKLADVPVLNGRILVLDGDNGFEALYKKSGLPQEMFMAIKYLLKVVLDETAMGRYNRNDFKYRLASRILKDKMASSIEYMDYIILIIKGNMVESA